MGDAILIIGAARSGVASAEYLLSIGKQIVISDMNTKLAEDVETQLGHASVSYVWGKQPDVAALQPELIVMSPGVPLSIPPVVKARELGIPVISEPELAFRYSDVPFVAITGTNGKTTTTTLTAFLLEKEGRKVVAGGNIGLPLISQCPKMSANDIVVAEMSSFQLESVDSFCPKVAVVMNLTPDHLDRHKTMEAYAAAKANIFKNQGPEEYLLLNKDDAIVAAMAAGAKSHVYYFSQQEILDEGIWLEDGNLVYRLDKNGAPQVLIPAAEIGIVGSHNWQNAMAASLAALLMGQQPEIIAERLRAFKGVAHRMEPVATIDGVLYVNDSKGTNPDSTEKALGSYGERPIVLIAGGRNKGSDMAVLVPLMRAHCRGVVLVGEATGDFIDAFERTGYTAYVCADSFEDAVAKAREMAQSGDVVLLSPACASWDMFDNFEQRGDLFKELVKDYAAK
ncbi:MAG: UDP-N-acetylmuramoyl-L-alanine--D-glutamate ligase [Peptococcaceae bacterium]|nr:UDP-N-acetylmuramoyl-L-alanine--D-glutamate ligase [Peptococcaceae bacterium]